MILERLIVEIDANLGGLQRELTKAESDLQRTGQKLTSIGNRLTVGLTLPILGAGAAAVKFASDAQEAANKFEVVFGGSARAANAEIDALRKTIPAARHELVGLAAGLQDLLKPLGIAESEAARMSLTTLKLAGDLASFNNVRLDDVLLAIRSGFVGQSEPLLRFGADVRAAAVQAKALELGLIQAGQAMTNAARAQAVLAIVTESNVDALGDAERTADSAANTFKFFVAEVKDLGVAIGDILLPVVTPMVQKLTEALGAFQDLSPAAQRMIVVATGLAAALGPLVAVLGLLAGALVAVNVALSAGLLGPILLGTVGAVGAIATLAVVVGSLSGELNALSRALDGIPLDKLRVLAAAAAAPLIGGSALVGAIQLGGARSGKLLGPKVPGQKDPSSSADSTAAAAARLATPDLIRPRRLDFFDLFTGGRRVSQPTAIMDRRVQFDAQGRRSLSNTFFRDIEKAGVSVAKGLKPLTEGAKKAGKSLVDFGEIGSNLKGMLDPTQILSGAAANLLSSGLSMAAGVIGEALFGGGPSAIEANTAAIKANTSAILSSIRGQAGSTITAISEAISATLQGPAHGTVQLWQALNDQLKAVGLTMSDFGAVLADLGLTMPTTQEGFEQLLELLESDLFGGLSGRMNMARLRMDLLDITSPAGQFAELQQALASSLPSALGSAIEGLDLASIGDFAAGILAQIQAGTFDLSQLGDVSLDAFLQAIAQMESLGDAAGSAADELQGLANAINAPSGFKVALERFRATAVSSGGIAGDPFVGGPRGGSFTVGDVYIQAAPGDDGRTLYRKFIDEVRRQVALGGADDLTLAIEGGVV